MSNNIRRRIDELDLTDRIAFLSRGLDSNNNNNSPSNNSSGGSTRRDEPDEFDLQDREDAWYEELAKHGYTFESLLEPGNAERVLALYQEWSREREEGPG